MKRSSPKRARVLSTRLLYRGPLFEVRRDRVREPGGIETVRDVIRHFGSVVLLPVLDDGRILLVRQYRHAAGEFLWELVAGHVERDEDPAKAARRELEEETGYNARRFRHLFDFFPTPGFLSEQMRLYLATGLTPGRANPEDDEDLEVGKFSPAVLERRIRSGAIRDGKTIAGLLYYFRFVGPRRS